MSDLAIRAEGLSKRYRIGLKEQFHALRKQLFATETVNTLFGESKGVSARREAWDENR